MKSPFKSIPIILVSIFYAYPSLALKGYEDAEKQILDKRNHWFQGIKNEAITPPPSENSLAAEKDRVIYHEKRKITGERKTLAEADKNQKKDYLSSTFDKVIFGENKQNINLAENRPFKKLQSLFNQGHTTQLDPKQPERAMEFSLKDHFLRGRPKHVLGPNGEYLPDYTKITGSSYPSGHAWSAYKQAATLSMLFPKKIKAIDSRAAEYGESRVIVGAHFPTDIIASRTGNYYLLAQHLADDKVAKSFAILAKDAYSSLPSQCRHSLNNCFATDPKDSLEVGNAYTVPTLTPDKFPKLANNLLRMRFAYLTEEQRLSIIANTAYSPESISGWNINKDDPNTYWGLINLPEAYDGPTYFYDDFAISQNKNAYSLEVYSTNDEWKKNLHGPGKLIKSGTGTLILSGNNRFAGLHLNEGYITLAGENTYATRSSVNGGELTINSSLNSPLDIHTGLVINNGKMHDVSIHNGGLLKGNGPIRNLTVKSGGAITPGKNKAVTIEIADSVTFEPNSLYPVEITEDGKSDKINSQGLAVLNGGAVNVTFQGKKTALTAEQIVQLLDKEYVILSAKKGVKGQFDSVQPGYTFVKSKLMYSPNDVILNFSRSEIPFASFAETPNQKAIATVLDTLPKQHPLYTSLILSDENTVKDTIYELSKPIHAHILSNKINNTLPIRRKLLEQVRASESLNQVNENKRDFWLSTLFQQENRPSDNNSTSYNASANGVFIGLGQRFYHDSIMAGIALGATQGSLSSAGNTSDNVSYHIAAYGGAHIKPIVLRGGFEYSNTAIDIKRYVNLQMSTDTNTSTYDITASQAFIEAAYPFTTSFMNIEPFTNIAYINTHNKAMYEDGTRSILSADKQSTATLLSMLGLRIDNRWALNSQFQLGLYGELGWQHQYGNLERKINLKFPQTGAEFVSQSVDAPRDSVTARVGANLDIGDGYKVSVDYSKLKSNDYDNNNINAKFSLSF